MHGLSAPLQNYLFAQFDMECQTAKTKAESFLKQVKLKTKFVFSLNRKEKSFHERMRGSVCDGCVEQGGEST